MTHLLKTWPIYFDAITEGRKTFEIRRNDRDFRVGDTLLLCEWDEKRGEFTAAVEYRRVSYILKDGSITSPGRFLADGMVCLGLQPWNPTWKELQYASLALESAKIPN